MTQSLPVTLSRVMTWLVLLTITQILTFLPFRLGEGPQVMAFAASPISIHMPTTLHPALTQISQVQRSSLRYRKTPTVPPSVEKLRYLSSSTQLAVLPRGGANSVVATVTSSLASCRSSPTNLFNATLFFLAAMAVMAKLVQKVSSSQLSGDGTSTAAVEKKPLNIQVLQMRFLSVFWLLRCSDWLQGPYFYEVYASKVVNGAAASMGLVSRLFLTGFASTALFGPAVGRAADAYGRKKATLAFTVLYAVGALTTKSLGLRVLFLGRILSGIGTSLLFSAPESWLVAEAQKSGEDPDGKYLGETFSWAYAGDSIVAIVAGQMAASTAAQRGPTGPFELSTLFLAVGGMVAAVLWNENKATLKSNETTSIREAVGVVLKDPKIMLVGAVQSLFEAAMYIFVLQWPPAMDGAIQKFFGAGTAGAATPYGTIFSCFMACCLLGSTMFGQLAKMAVPTEHFTVAMLTVATVAMSVATWTVKQSTLSLPLLMGAFFVFEACVGMYFPSIGTLRSRYVPDSHRSVIMNLFGIPLNVLVVSVFLSIQRLGVGGALSISSGALGVATLCMIGLRRHVNRSNAPRVADFVI